MAFPPVLAVQVDIKINPSKTEGQVVLREDSAGPQLDCALGPGTTITYGDLTLTRLPDDHNEDGDGCEDLEELGPNQGIGGLRDPFNPYDFFDVNGDKAINVLDDIIAVAGAFGLSTGPNYHPSKDRGPLLGPNDWNRNGPDGVVNVFDDILVVAGQFGNSCTASP
jgi:hypothetical protein